MSLRLAALRQVMLPCRDLERAVAFYRDTLGADLIARFPPGLAFFDLAGTRLLLEQHDGASSTTRREPSAPPARTSGSPSSAIPTATPSP